MSVFFDGIVQEPISYHGIAARAPLFYRRARMMAGVFTADLAALRAEMPTRRHHPLAIRPGRGVVAIHCLDYQECDIGPYREVSLSTAIVHGAPPWASALDLARATVTGVYQVCVLQLPVDTEAALWGGLEIFGFPKWLAAISFAETAGRLVCTVKDPSTGALVLEVSGEAIAVREHAQTDRAKLRTLTMTSYPVKEGQTLRARMDLNLLASGSAFTGRSMTLSLGPDPHADVLRRLGLGRLVQYRYSPRCEGILYRPEGCP